MPQGPKPPMAAAASANKRPSKDAKKTLVGVAPPPEAAKAAPKTEKIEKKDVNASAPTAKTAPLPSAGSGFKNALEEMAKRKADLAKTQKSEPPRDLQPVTARIGGSTPPPVLKDAKPAPPLPAKKPSIPPSKPQPVTAKIDAKPMHTTAKMPSKPPVPISQPPIAIPPPPVALQLPIVDAYAPMSLPMPPNLPEAAPAMTGPPAPAQNHGMTRPMTGPPLMPQPIMAAAPTTRGLGDYASPPPPVGSAPAPAMRPAMGSRPGVPDLTQRAYSAWSSEPALPAEAVEEVAPERERDLFDELPPDAAEASGQLSYQVFRPADLKKPRAPSRVDMEAFAPKTSKNAKIGLAVAGVSIALLTIIIIVLGSADDPPPSLAPATPTVTALPLPTYTTPTIATTSMLPVVTSDPTPDPPPPATTTTPPPKTRPKATGSVKGVTPPPNPYGGTPSSVLKPPKK